MKIHWSSPLEKDHSVRRATQAGVVARTIGLGMNVIALPVAFSVLGGERFSVFLAVIGLTQMVGLSGMGITKAIAQRAAMGSISDTELARNIGIGLLGSFITSAFIAMLSSGALLLWAQHTGVLIENQEDIVGSALFLVLFVITVGTLQTYTDLQTGRHQLWIVNLSRASGSLASIILVLTLVPSLKSITSAVASVSVGYAIGMVAVLATTPFALRRLTWPTGFCEFWSETRSLFREGWPFIFVQGASLTFLNMSPFLMLGVVGEAQSIAFSIHARALVLIWSVSAIIANPMWPALRRLTHSGNTAQARVLFNNQLKYLAVTSLGFALLFLLAGEHVVEIWLGFKLDDYTLWRVAFPLALVVLLGNQFLQNVLMGLGAVRRAAATNCSFLLGSLTTGLIAAAFWDPASFFGCTAALGFATVIYNARFINAALKTETLRID